MDLPERMQQKISSRIGNNRLVYEPYNLHQIQVILKERLSTIETDIIDQRGLEFISRKVSMYSGDIRRSLQIAKRAVELAKKEYLEMVAIESKAQKSKQKGKQKNKLVQVQFKHAIDAFNDLFNSKTVQLLKSLMESEVYVLMALHIELKNQGAERVLLDSVLHKTNYLYGIEQLVGLKSSVFREVVKRLQAFGLLTLQIESNKISSNTYLHLNVFDDELVSGFLEK